MIAVAPNLDEIGIRTGVMFVFMAVAALAGSPIAGALLTTEYIWWRAITFSAVSNCFSYIGPLSGSADRASDDMTGRLCARHTLLADDAPRAGETQRHSVGVIWT